MITLYAIIAPSLYFLFLFNYVFRKLAKPSILLITVSFVLAFIISPLMLAGLLALFSQNPDVAAGSDFADYNFFLIGLPILVCVVMKAIIDLASQA